MADCETGFRGASAPAFAETARALEADVAALTSKTAALAHTLAANIAAYESTDEASAVSFELPLPASGTPGDVGLDL